MIDLNDFIEKDEDEQECIPVGYIYKHGKLYLSEMLWGKHLGGSYQHGNNVVWLDMPRGTISISEPDLGEIQPGLPQHNALYGTYWLRLGLQFVVIWEVNDVRFSLYEGASSFWFRCITIDKEVPVGNFEDSWHTDDGTKLSTDQWYFDIVEQYVGITEMIKVYFPELGQLHWVAHNALPGCLDDYQAAYPTEQSAIDGLCEMFELGRRRRAELKRTGSCSSEEVRRGDDGRFYMPDYGYIASVSECDCWTPWAHNEQQPQEWFE